VLAVFQAAATHPDACPKGRSSTPAEVITSCRIRLQGCSCPACMHHGAAPPGRNRIQQLHLGATAPRQSSLLSSCGKSLNGQKQQPCGDACWHAARVWSRARGRAWSRAGGRAWSRARGRARSSAGGRAAWGRALCQECSGSPMQCQASDCRATQCLQVGSYLSRNLLDSCSCLSERCRTQSIPGLAFISPRGLPQGLSLLRLCTKLSSALVKSAVSMVKTLFERHSE